MIQARIPHCGDFSEGHCGAGVRIWDLDIRTILCGGHDRLLCWWYFSEHLMKFMWWWVESNFNPLSSTSILVEFLYAMMMKNILKFTKQAYQGGRKKGMEKEKEDLISNLSFSCENYCDILLNFINIIYQLLYKNHLQASTKTVFPIFYP